MPLMVLIMTLGVAFDVGRVSYLTGAKMELVSNEIFPKQCSYCSPVEYVTGNVARLSVREKMNEKGQND